MEAISFAGDGLAPELLPAEELTDCAETVLQRDGARILSYGTGAGYTPLRELIAEQLGVHPFRVLLTNGWLQGFILLAENRIQGQNVLLEYPTYDAVMRFCLRSRANLIYADLREDGLNLDEVEYLLRTTPGLALAYTMPTFQNPTGQTLPLDQRARLCSLALRAGSLLVEDDSFGLLRFDGEPVPTLFELSGQRSVYSTSFSHTLAPGLRVGVFIVPNELGAAMAAAASSAYIAPALLSQATVYEFMRRESFEPHLERLRGLLAERLETMLGALEQHLPDATWVRPEGGIFLLVKLPPGANTSAALARAEGVSALAGPDFGGLPNAVRLNFAACGLDEIETGIERLAAALSAPIEY